MKKFTKIILIITAVLAALGIILCGIASAMGAGWATIHRKALAGEFDFGNWHLGNGIYYNSSGDKYDWDDEDDWDDKDDWNDDGDCDDEDGWDDEDDLDENDAVEHFGSWILHLSSIDVEPDGTENQTENIPAAEVKTLELQLDVVEELSFETSEHTDDIQIDMKDGYRNYFSTEKQGNKLKVNYDSGRHHYKKGPTVTVTLPADCSGMDIHIMTGVGDVTLAPMKIRNLNVSVGVGNFDMEQAVIEGKSDIELGLGDGDITGGTYHTLRVKDGLGDISFEGTVLNKLKIECGTGDIYVELPEKEERYEYDLSTGMGDINLNGISRGAFDAEYETEGNQLIEIDLTSGMGDVVVDTKK